MKYTVLSNKNAAIIDAAVEKLSEGYYQINWFDTSNPGVTTIQEKSFLNEFSWDDEREKSFRKIPVRDQLKIIRIEKLLEVVANSRGMNMYKGGNSKWKIKADTLYEHIQTIIHSDEFNQKLSPIASAFIKELLSAISSPEDFYRNHLSMKNEDKV